MPQVSPPPLLSVVVPIYNVGSYLTPCLESVLVSSMPNLEIICVDDGSTDGSGELADEYAGKDERIRVLHVQNGGLGRARNIGTEEASGTYLAFVDSDDVVTASAYEALCGSLGRTGSDIATGRVRRFSETYSRDSGLHMTAIPSPATRTHISRMPSLVYDTTAWNKVFRRSFWDRHGLRFPEGVLYEDMPVTIPAHVLASSVDALSTVVYGWRERGDGSGSITQRRAELSNLRDRLTALEFVNGFLTEHSTPEVGERHDHKVLTLDMPLYLNQLDVAGADYREYLTDHMSRYLQHVPETAMTSVNIWDRITYELIRRRMLDEATEVVSTRKSNRSGYRVRRRGVRSFAELPYWRDRQTALPNRLYEVTNQLAVNAAVEHVEIRDDQLVVNGYAYVNHLRYDRAWCAIRALELRSTEPAHRVLRPMRSVHRPDLTSGHSRALVDYGHAGFTATVPLRALRPGETQRVYNAAVKIAAPGARRGVTIKCANRADVTARAVTVRDDGTYVAAYAGKGGHLRVVVAKTPPQVTTVEFDATSGSMRVEVALTDPGTAPRLSLRSGSSDDVVVASTPLIATESDPRALSATFSLAALDMGRPDEARQSWEMTIDETDGKSSTSLPVLVAPTFEPTTYYVANEDRELAARMSFGARLELTDRRAVTQVVGARLDRGTLTVELELPPSLTGSNRDIGFTLHRNGREDVEPLETARIGSSLALEFAISDVAGQHSLAPGAWSLHVHDRSSLSAPLLPIEVSPTVATQMPRTTQRGAVQVRVEPGASRFVVSIASGMRAERGPWNQRLLREGPYVSARAKPLTDAALFHAWSGKQYSCSPRAIFEQMRSEGRDERMVWARRDTSIAVPSGVPSVLMGSREYYECLATARYLISNDSMPPYYVKRGGTRYLQTWHGTPLKRIGFDIETTNFANVNYLEDFAVERDKWTQLVSPNRYSSDIFRRAFGYDGTILETGYPRNDVFYAPDVADRRQRLREKLGLLPHQRVILWAPTWRDDQRDARGRYGMQLPFDLSAWDTLLAPDDVLLFRGHQLIQEAIGGMLASARRVRNVTMYPDIQDLYLVADLLVTDYSSVMYDFANTRRPMIFFAWDLEGYRDNLRGFYVDYDAEVPGPIVTDYAGLDRALNDPAWVEAESAQRYGAFLERYCSLEDGHASERVVRALLGD